MKKDFNWLDEYGTELPAGNQQHERFSRIIEELAAADDKTIIRRINEEIHFEWHDAYNTGVKEIDRQHRRFLEIIKELAAINQGTVTCPQTEGLLDELLEYAKVHFQSEEELMEHHGYPKLDEHKREHAVLARELERQISGLKATKSSSAKMLYFLMQWFIKHTTYTDQEIGCYLRAQRRSLVQRCKGFWGRFMPCMGRTKEAMS